MKATDVGEWPCATVREKRPGAQYEGAVYDQDLVLEMPGGDESTVFDMTPMIGEDIRPGDVLEVIVGVAVPVDLKKVAEASEAGKVGVVEAVDYSPPQSAWTGFRRELLQRRWCSVRTSAGRLLMAWGELEAAFRDEPPLGGKVAWEGGRLDLMAWRRVR